MDNQPSWVYILQCVDCSLYIGCTTNLEHRIAQHSAGTFPGYTSTRRPVQLLFSQQFSRLDDAISAERQIKRWSRAKKLALAAGDLAMLHKLAECRNESHSMNKKSAHLVTSRLRSR
jgi:putative endonuclease